MRFSSFFQWPSSQRAAVVPPVAVRAEDAPAPIPTLAAEPDAGLPEALDERVRLVGEWQLGDA